MRLPRYPRRRRRMSQARAKKAQAYGAALRNWLALLSSRLAPQPGKVNKISAIALTSSLVKINLRDITPRTHRSEGLTCSHASVSQYVYDTTEVAQTRFRIPSSLSLPVAVRMALALLFQDMCTKNPGCRLSLRVHSQPGPQR